MLTALLRVVADGSAGSMADLAARLGTDERSLQLALAHCQQLGFVEPAEGACGTSACGGCPIAGACGADGPAARSPVPGRPLGLVPTWWRLTDRGARAVRVASASDAASA
jgi:hypothetical protein